MQLTGLGKVKSAKQSQQELGSDFLSTAKKRTEMLMGRKARA